MSGDATEVLQRIRAGRPAPRPAPGTVCELCTEPLSDRHGHLVDLEGRGLLCACRGCYLLFTVDGAGGRRFRAVPERVVSFPDVAITRAEWDALQIPVGVAFFFENSALDRVAAFYPSPAGATESLLSPAGWQSLLDTHPEFRDLEPDVEAILIRMDSESNRGACHLVPIDACYELVGELRRLWRGFDGGADARAALERFFDDIRARARPAS